MTIKLISALTFFISASAIAVTIEQKKIDFPIKAESLMKGESHYFMNILSLKKLTVQYPDVAELDSMSLKKNKDAKFLVTKTVSIVRKPVGFFDDKQLTDEKYISHINESNRVMKLGPESYKVSVDGRQSYKMKMFFDADDISTLPNSKIIRAVSAAKKLDVISQSASTTMVTEKTEFTESVYGAVSVASFIPMKENKTLIITYSIFALKPPYASKKILRENLENEIESVKRLQESFKTN